LAPDEPLPGRGPTEVLLYGAGGHARSICSIIERLSDFTIVGLVDDNPARESTFDWPVQDTALLFSGTLSCRNIVLSIGENIQRKQVCQRLMQEVSGVRFPIVCAATALVSRTAQIEDGTVIFEHAMVNADARVEFGAIINTGAIVEHDCHLGSFSSAGPGAVMCGASSLGENSFLGANASLTDKVVVGDNCVIGAAAVVITDTDASATYVGSPARRIST